jgi:enoyl-CoA hydratase/carnithine racemase
MKERLLKCFKPHVIVRRKGPSLVAYARYLDQEIAETEDGEEGARAFAEKREPRWKLR